MELGKQVSNTDLIISRNSAISKSMKMKQLSKEYWATNSHFTLKVTWRIIRKCAPFNITKRKYYICLNEKLEIALFKGGTLLNKRSELIRKCRHQNKFTHLRNDKWTKSNVFTEIFLAAFLLKQPFWSARLMFCILWFQNKNVETQRSSFIGEYCA